MPEQPQNQIPPTAVPPQVAAALSALVQALAPATSGPTGLAEQPPADQPTPEQTTRAQAAEPAQPPAPRMAASPHPVPEAGPGLESRGDVLTAILARTTSGRLRSRKLWTMVGAVTTLVVDNLAGLNLSPLTQGLIAGVAAVYIIAQALTDSGQVWVKDE
ncbi:hypothetical protein G3N56_06130 [Desulfovibrio sulfodismutans]|uniref:Uncharacterized protein n=1 Tax=Desulfolutivibrio sulfodismutans TaxID=63561 RepID=A0A7K3NJH3_9BACT|nr:hypothetical protein [Desulfolutivibrio sulfodismutans]NDY56320.1 hypothetical protein [Desulfolutivibrio sulfodismutans]QLA14195.1 hypothetical protein GD606_18945 [Desulfolutivibrio sulfodismutans DSM 3696]